MDGRRMRWERFVAEKRVVDEDDGARNAFQSVASGRGEERKSLMRRYKVTRVGAGVVRKGWQEQEQEQEQ